MLALGERAGDEEHGARAGDAILAHREVAVGEGEPAAELVEIDVRLEPVAFLGGAGEIEAEIRGDCRGRRLRGEGERIAERHVGERREDAAGRCAARPRARRTYRRRYCGSARAPSASARAAAR